MNTHELSSGIEDFPLDAVFIWNEKTAQIQSIVSRHLGIHASELAPITFDESALNIEGEVAYIDYKSVEVDDAVIEVYESIRIHPQAVLDKTARCIREGWLDEEIERQGKLDFEALRMYLIGMVGLDLLIYNYFIQYPTDDEELGDRIGEVMVEVIRTL